MSARHPAEIAADVVLEWALLDQTPGVDLNLLARLLGVRAIERRDVPEDGCVHGDPAEPTIVIRSDTGLPRQRFTIAHEIAHIAVDRGLVPQPSASGLEAWCNRFAAEVLAPRRWVIATHGRRPPSVDVVLDLSEQAGVSAAMALTRLRDVCHWTEVLTCWHRARGARRWRYGWAVGLPVDELNMLRSLHPTAEYDGSNLFVHLASERSPRQALGEVRRSPGGRLLHLSSDGGRTDSRPVSAATRVGQSTS